MRFFFALGMAVLIVFSFFTLKIYAEFFGEIFSSKEIYTAARETGVANLPGALPKSTYLKFAFVGDIMLDRDVEKKIIRIGGEDFRFPFLLVSDELREYDLLFGNLEGPVSNKGYDVGSAVSFRMDVRALEGLKFAGFDVLSVANNHSGDWGQEAFLDTISNLKESGIVPIGENLEPKIINFKNLVVAFLAFSDFAGPGARASDENIVESVSKAKRQTDLIIVSIHFGEEYQKEPSVRQRRLAELAADSGADLVVGHHPHVSQTVEKYKNSYIAYSLGNFIFDQNFSEETMKGTLLEVEIKDKKILEVRPREVRLNENYQPIFD